MTDTGSKGCAAAVSDARARISADGNDVGAWLALGAALERSDPDEAEAAYRKVIRLQPMTIAAYERLGLLLARRREWRGAAAAFDQVVAIDPANVQAMVRAAAARSRMGDWSAAERGWRRVRHAAPSVAAGHGEHAATLLRLGRFDAADEAIRRALAIAPDDGRLWHNHGVIEKAFGRIDCARAAFEKALALSPDLADAVAQLADFPDVDAEHPHVRRAAGWIEALPPAEAARLHLALARIRDRSGDHAIAFDHMKKAHDLRQADLVARGRAAEPAVLERHLAMAPVLSGRSIRIRIDQPRPTPIFILGMPRSGTTLVETILASHAHVAAGGELAALPALVDEVSLRKDDFGDPEAIAALDDDAIHRLADRYSARIARIAENRTFITDKMPFNFVHVGLIHRMFPCAPIIYCRRDAGDVALSCMMADFTTENPYLITLDNILAFSRFERAIMEVWRKAWPDAIHPVDYEALVSDPAATVNALFDACGLTPCDAWREPAHRTPVATLSAMQVRSPIHGAAVGRARAYATLAPALAQ